MIARAALLGAALGAAAFAPGVGAGTAVRVVDGDTLAFDEVRVRLEGIDAPESAQHCGEGAERWPCGAEATHALAAHLEGARIECTQTGRDRYGRVLARCRADGADIGRWMVRQGWAIAYQDAAGRYSATQREAESAKRGLWRGPFVAPAQWRRGARLRGEDTAGSKAPTRKGGDCPVKGNIARRTGERVYHVPGGAYYERTQIDPSRGERCFASEAQARAAGWRRSKR